jgi:putative tryptophan/tyrosine transport system substrate-binding protein
MRKEAFGLVLSFMLFALCSFAEAQQSTTIPRIGYLSRRGTPTPTTPDPNAEAFRKGLRDLGYIEGKNIFLEFRYAEGKTDRLPGLIAELIQLKVDILVSGTSQAIRAAKQATQTVPIVMAITGDPVADGLINSLARPGGNITGLTRLTQDLSGKRLELLKESVHKISRVGALADVSAQATDRGFKSYEAAARVLKIQLQLLEVTGPTPDLDDAFQTASVGRSAALVAIYSAVFVRYAKQIADLAIKNRLPSMFEGSEFVDAGGLMSYSANDAENFRRAALYVDKILKGAKPAELPVEQPTKFEFVINLKTAKQIGLTIPPNMLARADRVIK